MSELVQKNSSKASRRKLEVLVLESDAGARNPRSKIASYILFGGAFIWSLFQLWMASSLRFDLDIMVFNDNQIRSLHLAFALFLSFLAYPFLKSSPRRYIPLMDWVLAIAASFCAAYYFIFYEDLAERSGIATTIDITAACLGIILLLEATRRALGVPLLIISSVFLLYTFFGSYEFVPDLIRHKGQSLAKVANHQWLTTEGVFGIALNVSASFVFLFVLFGALLDKAGAGNYFIKVAFSLLGHFRGGPAKAAVLSSGMTGLISGSSIANTVTTGTFTIPLMKRIGFSGEKAGAVEVAASVNGQIMPPVMGAAAFLMVEYVGIPYIEVVKHAFLPAIISYIALLYIVHLEALKAGMQGLPRAINRTKIQRLILSGITISSIIILAGVIYFSISWIKTLFADNASYVFVALLFFTYIALLWYACRVPDLEIDDPTSPILKLPRTAETVKSGLHFLLPIAVLVWALMVEKKSPGLSAYWATIFMIFILVTQRYLKALFRKTNNAKSELKGGFSDLVSGMVMGARNMIGISIATAAAGIIVGTVSLTGIGQVLTEVIETIAGNSIILILILTAFICLILGMGLPTTANYIVVASLMAHVVKELGAQNGLFVPLIAIHLFVFYFGIMADVTPPVGLASFAAAAISGSDPIKTGVQAFLYSIRTAILPFFFIFNNELIMIGVHSVSHALWVFFYATVAILLFSAASQGYFLVKSKLYETLILFTVSITIFVPQIWTNLLFPSFDEFNNAQLEERLSESPEGKKFKIWGFGKNIYDEEKSFRAFLISDGSGDGKKMLEDFGVVVSTKSHALLVEDVLFNSKAEKAGIDFDFLITGSAISVPQPNPKYAFIPAILLLFFVIMSQSLRKREETALSKLNSQKG